MFNFFLFLWSNILRQEETPNIGKFLGGGGKIAIIGIYIKIQSLRQQNSWANNRRNSLIIEEKKNKIWPVLSPNIYYISACKFGIQYIFYLKNAKKLFLDLLTVHIPRYSYIDYIVDLEVTFSPNFIILYQIKLNSFKVWNFFIQKYPRGFIQND